MLVNFYFCPCAALPQGNFVVCPVMEFVGPVPSLPGLCPTQFARNDPCLIANVFDSAGEFHALALSRSLSRCLYHRLLSSQFSLEESFKHLAVPSASLVVSGVESDDHRHHRLGPSCQCYKTSFFQNRELEQCSVVSQHVWARHECHRTWRVPSFSVARSLSRAGQVCLGVWPP